MPQFLNELWKRRVVQFGALYLGVAWVLLQVVVLVSQTLHLPGWVGQVALLFLVLGFPFLLILAWTREPGMAKTEPPAMTEALPVPIAELPVSDRLSICVLPFANMSEDPQQEYFSDGISEDIITDLSKVSALFVTARNTAFTFKGKSVDIPHVARQLRVSHVLEGSVRKASGRVRITAQLIDGASGGHVWAERYDRDLSDIFALQDEISQAIVVALKLKLLPGEKKAIEERGTSNVEAYDIYLRARGLYFSQTTSDATRSIELYRSAVKLDPNFAQAWAALSVAIGASFIFSPETMASLRPEMEMATARAAELAPDLPEVHESQATQALTRYDWASGEVSLSRWVAPSTTFGTGGMLVATLGRVHEAVEYRLKDRRADPLSVQVSFGLQYTLDFAGRFDEAEAEYERSKDLPGSRAALEWRAVTRLMARGDARFKERLVYFNSIDSSYQPFLPRLTNVLDQPDAALPIIRAAYDDPAYRDGARMGAIAHWAVHYGDTGLAFKALERGYVERHGLTLAEIWHPIFAELRKDARFKDILRGTGLAQHWRKTGKWGDFARPLGEDDFEVW